MNRAPVLPPPVVPPLLPPPLEPPSLPPLEEDDELLEELLEDELDELLLDDELEEDELEDELEELLVDLRTKMELRVALSVLVVSTISSFPSVTLASNVCFHAVLAPTSS